jgi:hypothetical protein
LLPFLSRIDGWNQRLLEGGGATMEERERALFLSEHEVGRLRLVMTVVRSVQGYIPPLGPNGHKRAALPPMMGGTAALARAV